MTLARRHFQDLALKLKQAREAARDQESEQGVGYTRGALDALAVMEHSLILFCEAESPMFDRDKFQKAARI